MSKDKLFDEIRDANLNYLLLAQTSSTTAGEARTGERQ